MNIYLLIFFLGGPIVLAIGNLVLGPIFNKKIPFFCIVEDYLHQVKFRLRQLSCAIF